jgi:hypothetical protein
MDRLINWLHDKELNVEAALLLEAASPFAWLGAQAVYLVEPLLGAFGADPRALAELMEDPEQMEELSRRLRENS